MFNRIKRAYYGWRLRLIQDEINATESDVFECAISRDFVGLTEANRMHARLKNEERYYEFQLARVPQPT